MTLVLKNVYIDKLHDIINRCNNSYHNTFKMKPVDVRHILTLVKKITIKIQNLKLVIILES